jgi:GxxExxY protein
MDADTHGSEIPIGKESVCIRVHPWPGFCLSCESITPSKALSNKSYMNAVAHASESDLTEAVIGSAFEVANVLGAGFLEKVYERALLRELALRGLSAKAQRSFPVCYKGQYIGEYVADLVVEEKLIVELKCVNRFANEHLAQCINHLKASGLRVALLINFQRPKIEWRRVLLDH